MSKNIVICCDGTSNKFGDRSTNIVRLYGVLERNDKQLAFYDPGVGSRAGEGFSWGISDLIKKYLGLGFGYGLIKNVQQAYKYLMNTYEEGDKIYLFGYSRGAYTVRVLSGILTRIGLLAKGNDSHIPFAFDLYMSRDPDWEQIGRFKQRFCTECPVHFIGLFDSVSSAGNIGMMRNFPNTETILDVDFIRHAIAHNERRAYFRNNQTRWKGNTNGLEVWFAGRHGNIGGGNGEQKDSYAKVVLNWMIDEASGLLLKKCMKEKIIDGDKGSDYIKPNSLGPTYKNQWLPFWWILELLPRKKWNVDDKKYNWYFPFFRRRSIPDGSVLHQSLLDQISHKKYSAPNLPKNYVVHDLLNTHSTSIT